MVLPTWLIFVLLCKKSSFTMGISFPPAAIQPSSFVLFFFVGEFSLHYVVLIGLLFLFSNFFCYTPCKDWLSGIKHQTCYVASYHCLDNIEAFSTQLNN